MTDDLLPYDKYSTAFVSGGAYGPITYKPERAKPWEVGLKSDWLNKRLRAALERRHAQAVLVLRYEPLSRTVLTLCVGVSTTKAGIALMRYWVEIDVHCPVFGSRCPSARRCIA